MAPPISRFEETLIHRFCGEGLGPKAIKEKLRHHNFDRSERAISNVIKGRGKKREMMKEEEEWKYQRERTVLTPKVLKVIKSKFTAENPPTFECVASKLNIAVSTINYAVKHVLKMKMKKKRKVQILRDEHKLNRKRTSRKLYRNVLNGEKSKYVVTLDECWIPVSQPGSVRDHFYELKEEKKKKNYSLPVKENFPAKFMVVGAMCQACTFPLIKVPSKVTVNADYFVRYVLRPLINDHLIPHYGDDVKKVTIHCDLAKAHTARYTHEYMDLVKEKLGISYLKTDNIPVRGCDVSPLDFFGFGFLKQGIATTRAWTEQGVWQKCQQIWNDIPASVCESVYKAWKSRLLTVAGEDGGHIEHIQNIHRRKIRK